MTIDNKNLGPWPHFDEDEIKVAINIMRSGKVNYWQGGGYGKKFEMEFARWSNSNYAVAISNGSLALYAAYSALKLSHGDELITTSRTFIATSSSAVLLGIKPVFADVDRDSGAITVNSIEPLITDKTKAITVVHLAGWPADMDSICQLARKYSLSVIEDCSQAHGAKINGKSVGSFGDMV